MLVIISFWISLAVKAFIRGSKKLKDLAHVAGVITNERYIKYKHDGTKYHAPYSEDVFVLSIRDCKDEFGVTEKDKAYNYISKVRFGNNQTVAAFTTTNQASELKRE